MKQVADMSARPPIASIRPAEQDRQEGPTAGSQEFSALILSRVRLAEGLRDVAAQVMNGSADRLGVRLLIVTITPASFI